MGVLDAVLNFFKDLFESLFASSSPEYRKKHELKELATLLKTVEPPVYRIDGQLLPAFPSAVYQIFQFISPLREILLKTISSDDRRQNDRYRDYLLELAFTPEQRVLRKKFLFTSREAALIAQQQKPERLIEEQGKELSNFLKSLEGSNCRQVSVLLDKLDALSDFCKFGFNQFLSWFDPAFKAYTDDDATVDTPSFRALEVAEVIPPLLDLYYVLSRIELSPAVADIIAILGAKSQNIPLTEDLKSRILRVFQAVQFILQKKMGKEILLAIIRLSKQDPAFTPDMPHEKNDHFIQYRTRLTEQFHSDSRKLVKEQQENEISQLIRGTFGSLPLATLEGYNEDTNTLIQEFTTFSLEWIKPLQIIKTFALNFFEPHFRTVLRAIIVEGYFNNRSIQSSFSAAYYYCESLSTKLSQFESLFHENQPCSLKILTGYITEIEKGLDFEKPLRKIIENMNHHAKILVQQAVTQYSEVLSYAELIIEDNKRSVPEYITNLRALTGSTKNSESFAYLEKENGVFRNFLDIMKKYAIVGTLTVAASLADQTEK